MGAGKIRSNKPRHYSFNETLYTLSPGGSTDIGESIECGINIYTRAKFNTFYIEGIAVLNGVEYEVKNSYFVPMNLVGQIQYDFKYFAENSVPDYRAMRFEFEYETDGGRDLICYFVFTDNGFFKAEFQDKNLQSNGWDNYWVTYYPENFMKSYYINGVLYEQQ